MINNKIIPYLFLLETFLKSLKPLLTTDNYQLSLRFNLLFLEIIFLGKATYYFFWEKKKTNEDFLNYHISFPSYPEFFLLFSEIFCIQEYKSLCKKKNPQIIDCGCGWGMSVIYFKHFFPLAKIYAVEANKNTLKFFRSNMRKNHLINITVINGAVANKEGKISFYINDAPDGWSVSDTCDKKYASASHFRKIMVKSLTLSRLLTHKIDILKLDIEGWEAPVLNESAKKLNLVSEIILEYHPVMNLPANSLKNVIRPLIENNFTYKILNTKKFPRFWKKDLGFRMIHAFRN